MLPPPDIVVDIGPAPPLPQSPVIDHDSHQTIQAALATGPPVSARTIRRAAARVIAVATEWCNGGAYHLRCKRVETSVIRPGMRRRPLIPARFFWGAAD